MFHVGGSKYLSRAHSSCTRVTPRDLIHRVTNTSNVRYEHVVRSFPASFNYYSTVMVGDSMPSQSSYLSALQTWMQPSGTYINSVRIHEQSSTSRALHASAPLSPGTSILRIPPTHLITNEKASADPRVSNVLNAVRKSNLPARLPDATGPNAAILLYLLAEMAKGTASFWYPWLCTLPTTFCTPITVESSLVDAHLLGTPVHPFVQTLREELYEMYTHWFLPFAVHPYPDHFPAHICTYPVFQRAHAVLESRAFKIDHLTILAPFADMANHAPRPPARNARVRGWAVEDQPDLLGLEVFVGDLPVAEGQQICISYGQLPNWQLLVHYGFALPDCPDDAILVSLQNPEGDPDYMKKNIILYAALQVEVLDFPLSLADPLSHDILAATRVLLLEDKELEVGVKADYHKMVSPRNERAVVSQLTALITSLLDHVEVNEVEGGDNSTFANFCNIYVRSHLNILNATMKALRQLESNIPPV